MSSVSTGAADSNELAPALPPLTENARKVLEARYLKKNAQGVCVEEPETLFRRVARTVADLSGAPEIDVEHLAEALNYRRSHVVGR